MTDSHLSEKMRQVILAEIEKQRSRPQGTVSPERARMLGAFIRACLTNQGRAMADFARVLDVDEVLADAILEGLLPESEIDDEFLTEIALAVHYEPNVLRAMLGRPVQTVHQAQRRARQDGE